MKNIAFFIIGTAFLMAGCATTTGPKVSYSEVRQAKERLQAKAVKYRFEQLQRVLNIGYRLIVNLPEEDRRRVYPFLGIRVAEIDEMIKRAYDLTEEDGVVIIAIIKDTPAEKAGLQVGDIILRIGNKRIKGIGSFQYATSPASLNDKKAVEIEANRYGENKVFLCEVGTVPRKITFDMVDRQEINAGAGPDLILVTYGLMNFVKSDDEIAVVLAHEMAHITKGHISKISGVQMLTGIAAIGVGIISEHISPGSGADVVRVASGVGDVFSRSYSQDLEREADYFGLKYVKLAGFDYEIATEVWERFAIEVPKSMVQNYLNTHPTSPERMVRLQKIVEELKIENEDQGVERN